MNSADSQRALLRILKRRERPALAVLRREASALRRSGLPGAKEEAAEVDASVDRLEQGETS